MELAIADRGEIEMRVTVFLTDVYDAFVFMHALLDENNTTLFRVIQAGN